MTDTATTRSTIWRALNWCRSVFFFDPLIYLYTVVLGTLSLLSSLIDPEGRMQHRFARWWSWLILKTCCSPVYVVNGSRIDSRRPHVFAANHLSALDIPTLYLNIPGQFRIIAKRELFRYPFLGWHLRRSGQLPIDLESPSSSIRSLRKAIDALREGMPVVIFPEGGRSPSGQVQPFMTGAFYLAIKAQVDIVPLAIVGTFEVLPMNHYIFNPGRIELHVGEPISTAGLGMHDIGLVATRVQRAIEDMYYAQAQVSRPAAATSAD